MRKLLITCAAVLAVAASCEKKDSVDATLMGGEGNILLETTVKNADGVSGQSYLLQMGEIDGTANDITCVGAESIGNLSAKTVDSLSKRSHLLSNQLS